MGGEGLTHIDAQGRARMVDVGDKAITDREAVALCRVSMAPQTLALILSPGGVAKGDALGVARLAGIMAAKRAGELIPLCHPLPLSSAGVEFAADEASAPEGVAGLWIRASARCSGRTGVEMEAMVAATLAALTIYDMCKAVDKGIVIESIRLLEKRGGKSGDWQRGAA